MKKNTTLTHLVFMLYRYYAIIWQLRVIGVIIYFVRDSQQKTLHKINQRLDALEREFDALIKESESW